MSRSGSLQARLIGAVLATSAATAALADPCKAIPDRGPLPAYLYGGAVFSGPVVYIGDGDSLCVAVGPNQEKWVEVRLADFYAPELAEPGGHEAKRTLTRIVMGRRVSCVADHRTHDRVAASCSLNGRDLGDLMRAAGVPESGNGRQ